MTNEDCRTVVKALLDHFYKWEGVTYLEKPHQRREFLDRFPEDMREKIKWLIERP